MKISDYSSVTFITNSDRVLGTQGQDTKNFPVSLVSDYVVGRITTINKTTLANSVDIAQTSGTLSYTRVTNVPTVSTSANGLMTVQLYNELVELINRNNKLILISGATVSTNQTIDDIQTLDAPFNFVTIYADGPSSGAYTAMVYFYTTEDNTNLLLVASTEISNLKHKDYAQIITDNKKWCAVIVLSSGTIPAGGITAKVLI